jgi:Fe-coproporphyrin III synthase
MNEFSNLKAAWHLDRIQKLRTGLDIVPTHVQLIISDLCNQDCHFCAYRMKGGFSTENFPDEQGNKNPKRFIPRDKALEILDDCAEMGVGAIEFTGGGEPTVHPYCSEIVERAQTLGMSTGLVTNGVRLIKPEVIANLTWMRISLDAGQMETYRSIRNSTAWAKVMKNLEIIADIQGPYVGVGFVVTRENYTEIYQACELVKKLRIPYIRLSAMFSKEGAVYYSGLLPEIHSERNRAKGLEDETFKIVDFFDDRVHDLEMAAPDYSFCGYQQFVLYIGGDQKVYTCCTNAYTTHGEIGDLRKQRFADWIGTHKRFDFNARGCHHCQFNSKNKVIQYMVTQPAHVNFV